MTLREAVFLVIARVRGVPCATPGAVPETILYLPSPGMICMVTPARWVVSVVSTERTSTPPVCSLPAAAAIVHIMMDALSFPGTHTAP